MATETGDLLDLHVRRRREWLAACSRRLSSDPRFTAALLYGSLGRGTADAWSDIDLVVFLDDAQLTAAVNERLELPAAFGRVLYTLDSTWNAPLEGAQVNVLYDIGSGLPLYVDWNLFPMHLAARPRDTQVLFDHTPHGLPAVPATFEAWATYERQPRPSGTDVTPAFLRHAHFGMLPIAAKFVARRQREKLLAMLRGIGGSEPAEAASEEIAAVRERLRTLGAGQTAEAVVAIEALCVAAERTASGGV